MLIEFSGCLVPCILIFIFTKAFLLSKDSNSKNKGGLSYISSLPCSNSKLPRNCAKLILIISKIPQKHISIHPPSSNLMANDHSWFPFCTKNKLITWKLTRIGIITSNYTQYPLSLSQLLSCKEISLLHLKPFYDVKYSGSFLLSNCQLTVIKYNFPFQR